jgi:(1->4)-alpha-D-glucan 1-alpha-D-glucosylmutase
MNLPVSTYRVQLHKDFNLSRLRGIIDYLEQLGIGTIYAAPIFSSTPGSMHGYDVTDPHTINPEIGTLEELKEIASLLKSKGMTWVQDIVPNHMAFSSHNVRLMDVLERGNASPYYNYFDIDWDHPDPELNGKLMAPILGKEIDECLEAKEIQLDFRDSGMVIRYFDNVYPVSGVAFEFIVNASGSQMKNDVTSLLSEFGLQANQRLTFEDWQRFRKSWLVTCGDHKDDLERICSLINNDVRLLRQVLDRQNYALCFWKRTEREINYRRFFTVNSLICLRMESQEVFEEYHRFISRLYREDIIQGVRIDHIDGLNDPGQYLKRLRTVLGPDCYIIAEKILEAKEEMPQHWPLEGTSGYEFLSYVSQLFTDRKGTGKLAAFYHEMLPGMPSYEHVVLLNKRLILNAHMAGEIENLVNYFFSLNLDGGFERQRIKDALSLLMLSLPVYRIYPDKLPLTGSNLALIEEGFSRAYPLAETMKEELDHLSLLFINGGAGDIKGDSIIVFLKRMMQFTGPLTAKGVEDTTFYIYNPLISHVEVGDAPSTLGIPIQEFHKQMIKRQQLTPYSLNATATHDTKRGEDSRIRLNSLSEIPDLWIEAVAEWRSINKGCKTHVDGREFPIVNDEYFIYQSIVGGFPEDGLVHAEWVVRLKQYLEKVVREAKVVSSWESPNQIYERACSDFIDGILRPDSLFLKSLKKLLPSILDLANIYSIAQAVLKITAPGIPDIYQGCELLDLSYVDPDNRRPVDYELRKDFLEKIVQNGQADNPWLNEHMHEGTMKFFATMKCLKFRRNNALLFSEGAYQPLAISGSGGLAFAFARHHHDKWCMVILPFGLGAKNDSDATVYTEIFISLPANSPREWRNILTDEPIVVQDDRIVVSDILKFFPVAVLAGG